MDKNVYDPKQLTLEERKLQDIVIEHIKAENLHDLARIMATLAPGAIEYHEKAKLRKWLGLAQTGNHYKGILNAAPDLHIEVKIGYVVRCVNKEGIEKPKVLVRALITGKHQNTWDTLPGQGLPFEVPLCGIFRGRDVNGEILVDRESTYMNLEAIYRQIGIGNPRNFPDAAESRRKYPILVHYDQASSTPGIYERLAPHLQVFKTAADYLQLRFQDMTTYQNGKVPHTDPDELLKAFPDLKIRIDSFCFAESTLLIKTHFTGTHKQVWRDNQPTQKKISFPVAILYSIEEGKICESLYYDERTILVKLELAPDLNTWWGKATTLFTNFTTVAKGIGYQLSGGANNPVQNNMGQEPVIQGRTFKMGSR